MKHLLLVAIAISFASCASILEARSNKSAIIYTEPAGATVVQNAVEVGTTPYNYEISSPENGSETFLIKKDGFEEISVNIPLVEKKGYLAIDALLFCIPCAFDIKKIYSIKEKELHFTLLKPVPKYDNNIAILIDDAITSIADGSIIGTDNRSAIKFSKVDNMGQMAWFDSYSKTIKSYVNKYYFDAMLTETFEKNKSGRKPNLRLVPSIDRMLVDINGSSASKKNGSGEMKITWNFYPSNSDNLVYKTTTEVNVVGSENNQYFIDQLLENSIRQLVSIENLHDTLLARSKAAIETPIGTLLEIAAPAFVAAKDKKELFGSLVKGTVTVQTDDGFGSGFFISPDGYLITNNHVVDNSKSITIKTTEGYKLTATVVRINADFDIALLKVDATGLTCLSLGNSDDLVLGEEVFAIGTGADEKLGQSVSKGIVSGFRVFDEIPFIQTDVAINPGNSGGPLVSETGQVVGIATMKLTGDNLEGIGFCIPISKAIAMLNIKLVR